MSANQYMAAGVDSTFSLEGFKKGFNISITRYEGDEMEFEMKGVSCAVREEELLHARAVAKRASQDSGHGHRAGLGLWPGQIAD